MRFFNQKAEWHDELDRIAHATQVKVRQIIFKMMREAGLLTEDHIINPVVLSAQFFASDSTAAAAGSFNISGISS